jgi:NDP-4-keto-2,6-dideoxyhexose 3-C-methyltransferase
MIVTRIEKCRACGNPDLVPIGSLGTMAFSGIFPKKDDPLVPEGPLELVKCHGDPDQVCGLLQLKHSFDPRILFGKSYGYRSGLNGAMRKHLEDIAKKIRKFVSLKDEDIMVDVGSNDGTLLRFFSGEKLCLWGVDPTADQFKRYYPGEVRILPELFSGKIIKEHLGLKKAKVVTAIAVFYDLDAPAEFLEDVRDILSDDGVCVLEQSYLPLVLENLAYDTICHEHMVYYRLKQIRWLAGRAGLKIIHCEQNQVNGGSFCVVLAKKDSAFSEDSETIKRFIELENRLSLDTLSPFACFYENILKHREALRRTVGALRADHKRILGYGASTKGNVLLQFCGFTPEDIPFIADVNEDKRGRVCPGTKIPIISEEEARTKKPDVFFVLPWHFREAFLVREKKYLQDGGMFLFPLPTIDMVAV